MRDDVQAAVAVRGEGKARLDVLRGEIGEIIQHLRHRHAAAEIVEDIRHRDSRAANARFAAADARIDRDAFPILHGRILFATCAKFKMGKGFFYTQEGLETWSARVPACRVRRPAGCLAAPAAQPTWHRTVPTRHQPYVGC